MEDRIDKLSELYGKTSGELLERWDAGQGTWTVDMGGMGPGYEQCIQIMMFEYLRHLLAEGYNAKLWDDDLIGKDKWRSDRKKIDLAVDNIIDPLQPSGAQVGAALSLAIAFYRRGPLDVLEECDDRRIQVSKQMPSL